MPCRDCPGQRALGLPDPNPPPPPPPPPPDGAGGGQLDLGGLKFHTCAVEDPSLFDPDSFRQAETDLGGLAVILVLAVRIGEDFTRTQAVLYPADLWEESIAKANCEAQGGLLFTPAPAETPATSTGVGPAPPPPDGRGGGPETGVTRPGSGPFEFSRRFTPSPVKVERDKHQREAIVGYGAIFYDGTPKTEFEIGDFFIERIMPGAFKRALAGTDDVVALFNHDSNQVLGRTGAGTLSLKVDDVGLLYRAYPEDTTVAHDLVKNLAAGNIPGSSFQFIPITETWTHDKKRKVDVVEVEAVELFDVGPVMFPAYKTGPADVENARMRQRAWLKARVEKYKQRANMVVEDLAKQRFAAGLPKAPYIP